MDSTWICSEPPKRTKTKTLKKEQMGMKRIAVPHSIDRKLENMLKLCIFVSLHLIL